MAKSTILSESVKQLSSTTELEQHVNVFLILEWESQLIYEGMFEFVKNSLLQLNVINLFEIDDVWFRDLFKSENLFIWSWDELHSPKGSSP